MDIFPAPLTNSDVLSAVSLSGQTLSLVASATSTFTISAWPGAKLVEVTVTTNPVTVTYDGSVPSATNGLVYPVGGPYTFSIRKINIAKFRSSTGTAVVYGAPMTF